MRVASPSPGLERAQGEGLRPPAGAFLARLLHNEPPLGDHQGYRFDYCVGISQHLVIPEPQQPASRLTQLPRPKSIDIHPRIVLAAIDLNDQPHFRAKKIKNVSKTRMLTPEFRSRDLPAAQSGP